jgi:hypothetical protein
MSVEIEFPLEFIVQGTPVSLQAKRAKSIVAWQQRVKRASAEVLPEGHFATHRPMAVTLLYFPVAEMQGDLDNIVKPVLDALKRNVYMDDQQVERVWVQKFEPPHIFPFATPSRTLARAINGAKPLLFIRVGDDPSEGLS